MCETHASLSSPWRWRWASGGLVASVMLLVATARSAEPAPALVAQSEGTFLNATVTTDQLTLGESVLALTSGESIGIVRAGTEATEVELLGPAGQSLRRALLPSGVSVQIFDTAIAYLRAGDSAGSPYSLQIDSAGGVKSLSRKGRLIIDLQGQERHLVVSSVEAWGKPVETELVDRDARVSWRFAGPGPGAPRSITDGTRAAALYGGRPESVLKLAGPGPGKAAELRLPGAPLDDMAFVEGGAELLLWGSRSAALVDPDARKVLWQVDLPPELLLLPNTTSFVAADGDRIALVGCRNSGSEACAPAVAHLRLDDGALLSLEDIPGAPEPIASVARFQRGNHEELVLPHRVYALGSGR